MSANGTAKPCRASGPSSLRTLCRALALVLVLLAISTPASGTSAQQSRPNGAGLVVRHGDGTLIYAYVEFEGDTISGEELLLSSGLDFVVAPFGGLGTGICAIDGEGCPADNCYCESYDSPAEYWQYFGWTGSGWDSHLRGPTTRQLSDGDIDGWSWTAGNHSLPPVTIDEIAAITGFDRTPEPTPTPAPTVTPVPPPTATPVPTEPPLPTATEASLPTATSPPSPTLAPPATATSTRPPMSTATVTETGPAPAATQTPSATATATATSSPTTSSTATVEPTGIRQASPTATTGAGAVIIRPGETPEALEPAPADSENASETLLLFGGIAVAIIGIGSIVLIRSRQGDA